MAQHFYPENVSGAALATELTCDLQQMGHQVSFVTCAPNYPAGIVYPHYKNRWLTREELNGIKIVRSWSYITPSKSFWARIANFATFSLTSLIGALVSGRPDVLFSFSPPLPLGISAWLLSRLWRIPWVLRVEDLYPQAAIAAGLLKNKTTIRLLKRLELFLYRQATHVSLISPSMQNDLVKQGVPKTKLSTISVWADPEQIRPLEKENVFRDEYGLSGKFVVLYSGNLGYTSALEDVVWVAETLRNDDSIRFVFVGDGVKKNELKTQASRCQLDNIVFLPYQPRKRYPEVLAAADLCLVTINASSADSSLPSKVFNIMASGRPALAITPLHSDLAELIRKHACGVTIAPGDLSGLSKTIKAMQTNPVQTEQLGQNGRNAVIHHFSRSLIIRQYESLLMSAVRTHGNLSADIRSV